jgi:hypothetical protein
MALSILVLIALALLGIAGAWWRCVRMEARKARVAFVNEQLKHLYGPLFSMSHASESAWETFRGKYRPGGAFFDVANPPSQAELDEWVRWMRVVFTPMNETMVSVIVEHADLIEGDMPTSFLELIAHVEGYKVMLDKWGQGDFSEYASPVNFPKAFNAEVNKTFALLKARQRELMN